jgi:NTE family protein
MRKPIEIGLALSGGTAKSVAHVGVLKALGDAGIRTTCVAGTSGGAIVAALFAAGRSVEEMAEVARRTRLLDLGRIGFRRLGLFNSDKLYRLVADQIGEIGFSQLKIPCGIVVTNLITGGAEVIREGIVALAAQASCSIPQIYAPVEMNGSLYVDGGLVEYLPTRALLPFDPPVIVGSNLGFHRILRPPHHMFSLVIHVMGIVAQANASVSESIADVMITPDLGRFSPFEIKEAEAMIEVGYEETMRRIPDIEQAWEQYHSLPARARRWWSRAAGEDLAREGAQLEDPVLRDSLPGDDEQRDSTRDQVGS